MVPALVAGDMDGDGRDEIFAVSKVFGIDASGGVNELYSQKNPGRKDPGNNTMFDMAVCGDINGDLKADVLYYDWEGRVCCISADDAGKYRYRTLADESYPLAVNRERGMAIALANTDDDSYVLEYPDHDLRFTNPVVEAVIESPPYYGDTYPTNGHTTYGNADGSGTETGKAHGAQAKISAGFQIGTDTFGSKTWITTSGGAA